MKTIKMLTNFQTTKFGMLKNGAEYPLPDEDADGLIRNKRAEEVINAIETEMTIDELLERGVASEIKRLKNMKITKRSVNSVNIQKSADAEVITAEIENKIDGQIAELNETLEKATRKKKNK